MPTVKKNTSNSYKVTVFMDTIITNKGIVNFDNAKQIGFTTKKPRSSKVISYNIKKVDIISLKGGLNLESEIKYKKRIVVAEYEGPIDYSPDGEWISVYTDNGEIKVNSNYAEAVATLDDKDMDKILRDMKKNSKNNLTKRKSSPNQLKNLKNSKTK